MGGIWVLEKDEKLACGAFAKRVDVRPWSFLLVTQDGVTAIEAWGIVDRWPHMDIDFQ